MGGSSSTKLPETSGPIHQLKSANIRNTGAAIVDMDSPGCVIQSPGGINQDGATIRAKHVLELLVDQLEGIK